MVSREIKSIRNTFFKMIILCTFLLLAVIFIFNGGGVKNTYKTSFTGADAPEYNKTIIEFNDVWLNRLVRGHKKIDVWVEPERGEPKIVVMVDANSESTTLTVFPKFMDRMFLSRFGCNAKKVIIWVSSEEEKVVWEKWIEESEKNYFDYHDYQNIPSAPKRLSPGRN